MSSSFFQLLGRQDFISLLRDFPAVGTETVPLDAAHNRILAADVTARENLPLCDRSSMDGYAVSAQDLFGATEGNPTYLEQTGVVNIEVPPDFELAPGHCAAITTGGCLPSGADAVVMVEYTDDMGAGTIEIRKSVAPRENVMLCGEDARKGDVALEAGKLLRTQEIGLLAALGCSEVQVGRQIVVGIVSTGDEIVPIEATPQVGQVRDVNAHALACLVREAGAQARFFGIAPDDLGMISTVLEKAVAQSDLVLISGGSSVGTRDLTVQAVCDLPQGEVLAHGVAISPGKPTILARAADTPLIGLPGQVTSAQVVMHIFGQPFIQHLSGRADAFNSANVRTIRAEMARNTASKQGREDYVRIVLEHRENGLPLAHPRLGKSGLLKTLVQAHGLVRIDEELEGLYQGQEVDIRLL